MDKLEQNNPKPISQDVTQSPILSKELGPDTLDCIDFLLNKKELYSIFTPSRTQYAEWVELFDKEYKISSELERYDIEENAEILIDTSQIIIDSCKNNRFEIMNKEKIICGGTDLLSYIGDQAIIKNGREEDTKILHTFLVEKVRPIIKNWGACGITEECFGIERSLEFAEFVMEGVKNINFKESAVESFLKFCDTLNVKREEGVKNKILTVLNEYIERSEYRTPVIHRKEIDNLLNGSFNDFKNFFDEAKKVYALLKKSCDNNEENCSGLCYQITMVIGRYLNDENVIKLAN